MQIKDAETTVIINCSAHIIDYLSEIDNIPRPRVINIQRDIGMRATIIMFSSVSTAIRSPAPIFASAGMKCGDHDQINLISSSINSKTKTFVWEFIDLLHPFKLNSGFIRIIRSIHTAYIRFPEIVKRTW